MPSRFRYILFNKPYGVLCQFTPSSGHRTLSEFGFPNGVYSVGRLDADSEGLLLLTNDNALKTRLTQPRFEHPRTYFVQVERFPDDIALKRLRQGVPIQDYRTKEAEVERLDAEPDLPPRVPPVRFRKNVPTCWIQITIREGRNRQIRRMTAAVGHPTLRLFRFASGEVSLGNLASGAWRDLTPSEVNRLRRTLRTGAS